MDNKNKQRLLSIRAAKKRKLLGIKSSRALYNPKTSLEKIKMDLCEKFIEIMDNHSLNLDDLEFLAEMKKLEASNINNYRIETMTADYLVEKLELFIDNLKKNHIDVNSVNKMKLIS